MSDSETLTLKEVAALFAVPRDFAGRLVRGEGFPAPTAERTWNRAEVEAWGRRTGRLG